MPKGVDVTEYSTVTDRVFGGEEIVLSAPFDIGENGDFKDGIFLLSRIFVSKSYVLYQA